MTFDNPYNDPSAYYTVTVNSQLRNQEYVDSNNLFTTYLYVGDVVTVTMYGGLVSQYLDVTRIDFTTDAEYGNNGIYTVNVDSVSGSNTVTFTATTVNTSYNFEYHLDMGTLVPPSPTPTPSITATQTPTPSITPTNSITPTTTPTPTNTPTNTTTPTSTITPTASITPTITPTNSITPTMTQTPTPSVTPGIVDYTLYIQNGANGFSGYTSASNDGINFVDNTNLGISAGVNYGWNGVAVSDNNQYQIVCENLDYYKYSSDSGVTWTNLTIPVSPALYQYRNPQISNDGSFQVLVCLGPSGVGSGVYVSSNYGSTWTLTSCPYYSTLRMSKNGQHMLTTRGAAGDGYINYSHNYGSTWTSVSTLPVPRDWKSGNLSNDGQTMGVYSSTSTTQPGLYTSQNGGATWIQPTFNINPVNSSAYAVFTISGDGQYVFFMREYIWRSTDYGVTFTRIDSTLTSGLTRGGIYINNSNIVFAFRSPSGNPYKTEILKSTDYGLTWSITYTSPVDIGALAIFGYTYANSLLFPLTPTPTPTQTSTPTLTPTNSVTPTPTLSVTPTMTKTPTKTPTQTPTRTVSPTITPSNTPSVTPTLSLTPTNTTTPTNTPTMSLTPTLTPTPSATPQPMTLQFRYIGSSTIANTKQIRNLSFTLNGVTYTRTNADFISSTNTIDTVGTAFINSGSYVFNDITRRMCKSTNAGYLMNHTIKIYNSTTLLYTRNYPGTSSVPVCPATNTETLTATSAITINPNDTIIVEWTDNFN